jgi:hypothetical protein
LIDLEPDKRFLAEINDNPTPGVLTVDPDEIIAAVRGEYQVSDPIR